MGEPIGKREIFRKYPDVVDVPQLCEMLEIGRAHV